MSTTKKIQLISGLPQTDWNETDETKPSYLKNKPTALPSEGGNADTVNNHTVNADVPADANGNPKDDLALTGYLLIVSVPAMSTYKTLSSVV